MIRRTRRLHRVLGSVLCALLLIGASREDRSRPTKRRLDLGRGSLRLAPVERHLRALLLGVHEPVAGGIRGDLPGNVDAVAGTQDHPMQA
jgi:hypothetical protein